MTEAHLPRAPAVPGSHRSSPGDHEGGLGSRRTVPGQQGVRGRNPRRGKGVNYNPHIEPRTAQAVWHSRVASESADRALPMTDVSVNP